MSAQLYGFDLFSLPSCFPRIVHQRITILLSHSNHKLVDAHGRVDRYLPSKVAANGIT
jgi:hypothetical protein